MNDSLGSFVILRDVEIATFKKIIWDYYTTHKRAMPWRTVITPYDVFISEVMLQQTQVARVMEKFPQFIALFPNFKALKEAPLQNILHAWQGMGYNRRALYLQKAAGIIVDDYAGNVPRDPDLLIQLAGIGTATARAIAVYAWNIPMAFIETNVRAVFLHHFFKDRANVSDKELMPFVEATLDVDNPREWYYALMDYGVMLKRIYKNPARRSAHYVRQSPFKGSVREARGKIVRMLHTGPLTSAALCKRTAESPLKIKTALHCLMRDGLIKKEGRIFSVV